MASSASTWGEISRVSLENILLLANALTFVYQSLDWNVLQEIQDAVEHGHRAIETDSPESMKHVLNYLKSITKAYDARALEKSAPFWWNMNRLYAVLLDKMTGGVSVA